MISEQKYSDLLQHKAVLAAAYKSNYASLSRQQFNQILDIYYDNQAEKFVSRSAFNCPKCKLKELIKIAKALFNYEAENGLAMDDIKNKK